MTIAELEKKYPYKKYEWIARLKGFPNWNYKPEDIVVDYKVREVESKDITDALFGKGPIKVEKVTQLVVNWERAKK